MVATVWKTFVIPSVLAFSVGAKVRAELGTKPAAKLGARVRVRLPSCSVSELISARATPPSSGAQVGVARGTTLAGVVRRRLPVSSKASASRGSASSTCFRLAVVITASAILGASVSSSGLPPYFLRQTFC